MSGRLMSCVCLGMLAALASGCVAASTAPEGWRRSKEDVQRLALGSWTRIEMRGKVARPAAGPAPALDGELIAADTQSVVLAQESDVTVVPVRCVTKMTVAAFEPGVGEAVVVGSLGTVSTLSHGFFLVLTAPIWLVTTMSATWAQSGAGTLKDPKQPAAWARFPQGMPSGFLEQARRVTAYGPDCRPAHPPESRGGPGAP
jgi:hypothetical protein